MSSNLEFTFDSENVLNYNGTQPQGGSLLLTEKGEISLAIHNGVWCATKSKNEAQITLKKYNEENCIIPDIAKDPIIILNGEKEIHLKIGEIYQEKGAIAKTLTGDDLTYEIEIKKGEQVVQTVNTSSAGTYTIIYEVNHNNKTVAVTRIVVIEEIKFDFETIMNESDEVLKNDPNGNPRYVGSNPNNYVRFNNELWRIIGIFNGQVKLIRDNFYGKTEWDKNEKNGGHGPYGYNDWSISTLQIALNGSLLNGINETYRNMIDEKHLWNLGGFGSNYTTSGTCSSFYSRERGTTVYSGRPTTWTGAIGLMYISDYGYSTSARDEYFLCINRWVDSLLYCLFKLWEFELLCSKTSFIFKKRSQNKWRRRQSGKPIFTHTVIKFFQ